MLKHLNANFRADIGRAIAEVERQSHAELVVVVKPQADGYSQYPLAVGSALAFTALSYFRFSPDTFDDWMIYGGTIAAFVLGAVLVGGIPAVLRRLVGRKRMEKSTEILARAYFQKGGVHRTQDHIGVLIFVAVLERQVAVIADWGVESAIPPGEWAKIRQGFNGIFKAKQPTLALMAQLQALPVVFSQYVPQIESDINELPDQLDIDLLD
ncbi:MAG: hypothetical protein ACKN9T_12085 [Candidatus Methylumidiphilus sp.]